MKQSLNPSTLAYQIGMRPGLQHRDMSDMPLVPVVKALSAFQNSDNAYSVLGDPSQSSTGSEAVCGSPERDGLMFYMLNHAVSLVRQKVHVYEPLGKYLPILELYHAELAMRATRMFHYLTLICTRESRHDKSGSSAALANKYGGNIIKFHQGLKGHSSSAAAETFMSKPPVCTVGAYTSFLSDVFYQGSYSGGFGGKAWGKVADVLRDYVRGAITAEMMMDTAFTLCHNNGPIFNKGMLFDSYSADIYKILDVQRSGQIPQLVASQGTAQASKPVVMQAWKLCADILGPVFEGHVDWFLVEELGAMKSYPDQKAKQVEKYGYPSKFKAKKEVESAKAELAAKNKLDELKSSVEIFPGQFIKKVKRSK